MTNRPLYMTRRGDEYSLTYDDSNLPDHYGWKVDSRLDAIEAAYRTSLSSGKSAKREPSPVELRRDVQRIIAELDGEGRWISTFRGERLPGQPKFRPGDRYLHSGVFSQNVETLSAWLAPKVSTKGAAED
jgi:hypothetical protein